MDKQPFYAEINDACKRNTNEDVTHFGAFVTALTWIMKGKSDETHASSTSSSSHKTGEQIGGLDYNMAGAFLVYCGGSLPKAQLKEWAAQANKSDQFGMPVTVRLPAIAGCTSDIDIAIERIFNK